MPKKILTLAEVKALHEAGQSDDAIAGYETILQDDSNLAEAWHYLGVLYHEKGDLQKARDALQKALSLSPQDVTLSLHLANILKAAGHIEEASKVLHEAILSTPNFAALHHNLGTVYFSQKEWKKAISEFEIAIDLQTNYVDAYYHLGLSYHKLGQLAEAKNAYEAVLLLASEHPGALFQLGCFYMQKESYQQAVAYFLQIVTRYPYHFESLSNLATCYVNIGALSQAKLYYLKAMETTANDTQVLYNLAVVSMQEGNIIDASDYYQKLLMIDPNLFAAHHNLAVIYMTMKNDHEAKKHFREALRLQPNNLTIKYYLQVLNQGPHNLAPPKEYITTLFDAYADHYDAHLTDTLHYQLPNIFFAMVNQCRPNTWRDILDLGCGTGLCGKVFQREAHTLVGVDLSQNMLSQAEKKKCYTTLVQQDITAYLQDQKSGSFDLVLAADTFVYHADLTMIFTLVAKILRKNGLFIFNCEASEKMDGAYHLSLSGRFTHSKAYLDGLIKQTGWQILQYQHVMIRTSEKSPIMGHVYLLQS